MMMVTKNSKQASIVIVYQSNGVHTSRIASIIRTNLCLRVGFSNGSYTQSDNTSFIYVCFTLLAQRLN